MGVQVGCAPAPTHTQLEIEAMAQQIREQEIADAARFVRVGSAYTVRRVEVDGVDCIVATGKYMDSGVALDCNWQIEDRR